MSTVHRSSFKVFLTVHRSKFIVLLFLLLAFTVNAQAQKQILYLLPGFGGDQRIFSKLALPAYELRHLEYLMPVAGEELPDYAQRMSAQIDTTVPYSFLGVSFGGMVFLEMTKKLKPEHTFLISSAKNFHELPFQYRFQRTLPLYKVLGGNYMKRNAWLGAWLFDPPIRKEKALFQSMLAQKDPVFLERVFEMIVHWENDTIPTQVVHIHGDKDRTLPYRRVKSAINIKGGTHWMVYFRADEIKLKVESGF